MNAINIIPLFIGNLRGFEWLIIILVILLLFGGKKIPELMRGIGKGISSFKQGLNEAKDEINKSDANSDQSDKSKKQ
ncbi:twin-arginine translocase TatA/TatE family subunit [uncultured Duncaniella sp.]|uniref:Sec-independent protein translocase subunit TatA/TatB n=1 Tax=uncultured Duncaniella sp. TaxID=2768039 RepID=UPI002649F42D|nr:twin-arginine translocase TatA/TatE family subunit [uncultured Duncaniella sp.]